MKLVLGKSLHGRSLGERINRFVMPVTESGCHIWLGATNRNGYGMLGTDPGKYEYAHRIAYKLAKGPIPGGFQVDHLCRVRCCVNPDHLEAVTIKVNAHRSESVSGKNTRKTHCPNGHPYAGDNLHVHPKGYRRCKICRLDTMRRFYENNPSYAKEYRKVTQKDGEWKERAMK